MIHTHWSTAKNEFSMTDNDPLRTTDIELSIQYNIPVYLAHPQSSSIQKFDPKAYKKEYFSRNHYQYKDDGYGQFDKDLVNKVTTILNPPQ